MVAFTRKYEVNVSISPVLLNRPAQKVRLEFIFGKVNEKVANCLIHSSRNRSTRLQIFWKIFVLKHTLKAFEHFKNKQKSV